MTTITIDSALLEQALRVLTSFEQNYGNLWQSSYAPEQIDLTCSVIRAELAKPEESVEPVACMVETESGAMVWPIEDYDDACTYCDDGEFPTTLYLHPPTPHGATRPRRWRSKQSGTLQ